MTNLHFAVISYGCEKEICPKTSDIYLCCSKPYGGVQWQESKINRWQELIIVIHSEKEVSVVKINGNMKESIPHLTVSKKIACGISRG